MAPHLTDAELDFVSELKGKGLKPVEIYKKFVAMRKKAKKAPPTLAPFRLVLKGTTYRKSKTETRGVKRALTPTQCRKIFEKRKELIQKHNGEKEVCWAWVLKACRIKCDPTTAVRNLKANGYDVAARKQREKPVRTEAAVKERYEISGKWKNKPASY